MKKDIIIRTLETILKKIKSILDYLAIISVFGILIYRLDALRKICKSVCVYFTTWYVHIDLKQIKSFYFGIEKGFRLIVVAFLLSQLLRGVLSIVWGHWLKNQNGTNRFEKSLFRYLRDANIPRCFLVTGEWGSGKTFDVQKFFDKYYRYSRTKVYRISCFGLDSRKNLVKEISNTIEQDDNSFQALIIKVLQFIPVIGTPLEKFFKKTYGYDTVKPGSIFIFDDFERVTSRAVMKDYSYPLYKKSSFLFSGTNSRASEFKNIEKEFEKVEKSLRRVDSFVTENLERMNIDKYNVVIGLINDIVETYNMKAVIICNSDILGEKFVHDILRSKLNCIEYRKYVSPTARVSMVSKCLQNEVFENQEKQEKIRDYMDLYIIKNIEKIPLAHEFDNLRLFGGLLEAFVITANLFEKNDLTKEFLNSLFNSIMITHSRYYDKSLGELGGFQTGANIDFLMRLYSGTYPDLIQAESNMEKVKWIDVRISGYWIMNLSVPTDIRYVVENWKNYKYNETEKMLCENEENMMHVQGYNLLHIFYYYRQIENIETEQKWDFKPFVDNALRDYDLSKIEVVQSIIDSMGEIFGGRIFADLFKYLFKQLSKEHKGEDIIGDTYIHNMYNKYCEKGKLFE